MSYANLSDMLAERGSSVHRSTLYRWFVQYSPILHRKLRRHYQFIRADSSWQLDETYIKVKGKWCCLYRAIDKQGRTIDLRLSSKRDNYAAYQFLRRCLKRYRHEQHPKTLNTDKHASYANAISELKRDGRLRTDVQHRQVKYLNNRIESDHAPIKKLIEATGDFKVNKRANATIHGFESLRMLNKGQFDFWLRTDERKTLVQERSAFMNRVFNVERIFA